MRESRRCKSIGTVSGSLRSSRTPGRDLRWREMQRTPSDHCTCYFSATWYWAGSGSCELPVWPVSRERQNPGRRRNASSNTGTGQSWRRGSNPHQVDSANSSSVLSYASLPSGSDAFATPEDITLCGGLSPPWIISTSFLFSKTWCPSISGLPEQHEGTSSQTAQQPGSRRSAHPGDRLAQSAFGCLATWVCTPQVGLP